MLLGGVAGLTGVVAASLGHVDHVTTPYRFAPWEYSTLQMRFHLSSRIVTTTSLFDPNHVHVPCPFLIPHIVLCI